MALRVTDILIRGGGGTITFSDNVTLEYVFQFRQDPAVLAGGVFGVTLVGDRATLVYQNVVSQSISSMVDWLLRGTTLNARVALLEANAGLASQFTFSIADWLAGTLNEIHIPDVAPLIPGDIGAHGLGTGRIFHITVFRDDGTLVLTGVDIEFKVDLVTGLIRIIKSGLSPAFNGRVIVS